MVLTEEQNTRAVEIMHRKAQISKEMRDIGVRVNAELKVLRDEETKLDTELENM